MSRRSKRVMVVAVAALCTIGGITSAFSGRLLAAGTSEPEPIKIGFITSLSGAAAPSAKYTKNGIDLWLDQIHHHLAGHPVEVIVENDESSPVTAIVKLRKLIEQDHVQIIDGFVLANVGYAAAPLSDQYKIPFIYNCAAGDDLTQRQHFNWIVRTGWSASQPTQPFGEWAFKTKKYQRIITLGMNYQFGWEQVGGFQKAFEEAGGKVVQKIWAPLGFADFRPYIQKMRPDADAVFLCTFGHAAELFPKQYKEVGPKLPVLAGGSAFDESVLPKIGDAGLGAISVMSYSAALKTAANKKFVAAYEAKYHEEPNWYVDCGYTSGLFIEKAVEALKGDVSDKTKLLAALKTVELKDAPRGPVKLDSRANPIQNVYVRRVEKVNGKLQNTVIDTFENVSQFFHWTEPQYLSGRVYSASYPPCKNCQ